ncbi:MAG: hypothetical protein HYV51_03310 [Parcubacteria group bacterium]|nr:hypothetical protein [Parcubacteria group bacterium]
METESKNYRERLATAIKSAPKELRRAMLKEAQQSGEYIDAYIEHYKPKWERKRQIEKQALEARTPQLEFDLEDETDFREKVLTLADFIYSTLKDYDPYKGHMSCGEITNKFIEYFNSKGIKPRKIERIYSIKDPEGNYNENFGHVYLVIDSEKEKDEEEHILIDPTYLQWVSEKERTELDPVLMIRYTDADDFKSKFSQVPIKKGLVLPFYLGFDSKEARDFFKNAKYTVISDEMARIDD